MSQDTTDLLRQALAWIDQDPGPQTRSELADVIDRVEKGDEQARADLASRFAGHLTFGTAGLRAQLGAGPMRMNRVVVSHAAYGLGQFLIQRVTESTPSIVIGFDARHNSDVFARDSAEILQAMGIRVSLMDQPTPTPVLAFAVRHLGVDAGVMVTASHNPPSDNGYKVYLGGPDAGSQIVPPADQDIHAEIMASHDSQQATAMARDSMFHRVGRELIDAYLDATFAVTEGFDPSARASVSLCYTPLHGVGGDVFLELLSRAGFHSVHVVEQQFQPDGDFPTVAFPNPEEPGALDLAVATATEVNADVIIAHDPDADRLAVALPDSASASDTGWTMLSGNQLGAILAMRRAQQVEASGRNGVIGYSLVSSPIAHSIARHHGLNPVETPTGFKWISRLPDLVFGYEEALGYLVNPDSVRDKDGISAGVFFACLAAELRVSGKSMWDCLDDVRNTYGGFASDQISLRFDTMVLASGVMDSIRRSPVEVFGSLGVDAVTDLAEGTPTMPPTNLIVFSLAGGDRVIVRPSGTEPKLKVYLDCVRPDQADAEGALEGLNRLVRSDIDRLVAGRDA